MAAENAPVRVLVHCANGRDLSEVGGLLDGLGASWCCTHAPEDLDRALRDSEVELALADAEGSDGILEELLGALEACGGQDELPVVVLAGPEELDRLAERTARRDHAILFAKPFGRCELAAAIRSALALRGRQREYRALIERLRAAGEELERRGREAEADCRRRIQLLAAISHNLRTPVNEIMLFCQVVQAAGYEAIPPADWEMLAGGLFDGAAALRELVDDLVDIASYDLGRLDFHPADIPLGPFLHRTLDRFRGQARDKGLAFRIDSDPASAMIRTDPDHLARVLQNLASNAIKFTDAGEVRVSARVGAEGEARLEVRDTGRGIAPEEHAGIFDEFTQVSNPARQRTKGTGLGLAICRRLAAAMGGRIELDSAPGQGSRFTLVLPAAAEGRARVASESEG